MSDGYYRGARVKRSPPLDRKLTMSEAALVICSIAEAQGFDAENFVAYMRHAWDCFKLAASTSTGDQ